MAATLVLCAAGRNTDELRTLRERASHTPAYSWLRELTDSIGPRLTGSTEGERAAEWAMARMKKIGLANVHLEPWELRSGWERGRVEVELMPQRLTLNVASYGWTGSTRGGAVEGELVEVQRGAMADALRNANGWEGKIVFLSDRGPKPANQSESYVQLPKLVVAAQGAGAAAVIARDVRPGLMLTHTGPVQFSAGDTPYEIPVLDIANEHQKLIERLIEDGRPIRLRLNVQNRFVNGPVRTANVSGEIRGREDSETVLLAAHLDSWDLGTGAIDDGTGVAAVLGAAEAIRGSGLRPRRTIRVVLFTGEEQGLLGSREWVRSMRPRFQTWFARWCSIGGKAQLPRYP